MTKYVFRDHAPKYWEAALCVVPLKPYSKRPVPGRKNWNSNYESVPSQADQNNLIERYPNCGIGLLLGTEIKPGFRLLAADVDDDVLVRVVQVVLGKHPSGKRGKKGATFFAVTQKSRGVKSTTIEGSGGIGNIDLLAGGKMTVLPPSIHPETKLPFVWVGDELLMADPEGLPVFDARKLELLRKILKSENTPTIISGQHTHNAGLSFIGQLVNSGCGDEEIGLIFSALLPIGYKGNSREELPEWIRSAREKSFDASGEASESKNQTTATKILDLCNEIGVELFHDQFARGFLSIPQDNGGDLNIPIKSNDGKQYLRCIFFERYGKPIALLPFKDLLETLEANAAFGGPKEHIYLRSARWKNNIYIDLGREDAQVVQIGPEGWVITTKCPIRFHRAAGFEELPLPSHDGSFDKYQEVFGLSHRRWHLILAFLLNCLRSEGPYMCLFVEGEQGSGKSVLCESIKRIIDPNLLTKMGLPCSERDLFIHAKEFFLLLYDNTSGVKNTLSDALCGLATGSGFAIRKNYTDDVLQIFVNSRPFIINGITEFARRPDLLERAIPLELPSMPKEGWRLESEIWEQFNTLLPGFLGCLYDLVAAALKNEKTVEPPLNIRMADSACWIKAAEVGSKLAPGTLLGALQAEQNNLVIDRVLNDSVVVALLECLKFKPFEGTAGDLLKLLEIHAPEHDKYFPSGPSQLSKELARLKPAMKKVGINFERCPRMRDKRLIKVWKDGQEGLPPQTLPTREF